MLNYCAFGDKVHAAALFQRVDIVGIHAFEGDMMDPLKASGVGSQRQLDFLRAEPFPPNRVPASPAVPSYPGF